MMIFSTEQIAYMSEMLSQWVSDKYTNFGLMPESTFVQNDLGVEYVTPLFDNMPSDNTPILLVMIAGDCVHPGENDPVVGEVVSEGTLRTEDLIRVFENWLTANGYHARLARVWTPPALRTEDSDTQYLEELYETLEEIGEENRLLFGSHPGDGALIGFWDDPGDSLF